MRERERTRSVPVFCDSTVGSHVSETGDSFVTHFDSDNTISIPEDAEVCVYATGVSIIWYVQNIPENATIFYSNSLAEPEKYSIVIPEGMYDPDGINAAISIGLVQNDHDSDLIQLIGNPATQKLVVTIKSAGWQAKWSDPTFTALVGATVGQMTPDDRLTLGEYREPFPNVANFGAIKGYNVSCPEISEGVVFNGGTSNLLVHVPVVGSPGSLLIWEPARVMKISADHLAGTSIKKLSFYIRDQSGNIVDLAGERWQIRLIIEYKWFG